MKNNARFIPVSFKSIFLLIVLAFLFSYMYFIHKSLIEAETKLNIMQNELVKLKDQIDGVESNTDDVQSRVDDLEARLDGY